MSEENSTEKETQRNGSWRKIVRREERQEEDTQLSTLPFTTVEKKRGGDEVFGMRWHIKSAIVSHRHWNMDVI